MRDLQARILSTSCASSRRTPFPPEVKLLPFLREDARPPPEVKLTEGSRRKPSFFQKAARGEASRRTFASFGKRHPARGEASRRKPKDAARGEASRRKRRTPFLREDAEGRPSFGRTPKDAELLSESRRTRFFQNKFRKPKDVLFSKQVASFGNLWRFLRKAARGEASRRTRFFQNKFRKPKDALFSKQVHQAARGEAFRRTFRNKFSFFQKERACFPKEAKHGLLN